MSSRIFWVFLIFVGDFFYTEGTDLTLDPVIPKHYNISILALLDESKFEGVVDVLVECMKETKMIKLHAVKLQIDTEKITVRENTASKVEQLNGFDKDEKGQYLVINLGENLSVKKQYLIHIEYKANLETTPEGFYMNYYQDENEAMHNIANTHFEPTMARNAFPSFDLPHLKAIFQISVGRHENFSTLNNMPLAKSEPIDGRKCYVWDHYQETPLMSTYLVAWAVLDDGMKNISAGRISLWYPPMSQVPAVMTVKKAEEMLDFLENHFDMKYELKKLDFLVVNNFPRFAGACENWGLIIMAETSVAEKNVLGVVAHEIVHQWIGNIITMKCFGELWLKEGLTSHFTDIVVEKFDENQPADETIAWNFRTMLGSFLSTPLSIEKCPEYSDEIIPLYKEIIYKKGALFTRMIHLNLGLKDFKKTTQFILKKHKFQNFDESDLWTAVKETMTPENFPQNLDLAKMLESWTKQGRYPLVEVSRDYQKGTATLVQRKFFSVKPEEDESCWWIPISYTTQSELNFKNTTAKNWMNCPRRELVIENLNSSDWILINLESAGLFVVKYDEANFKLLTETLTDKESFKLIPFWDKHKIVFDCTILANLRQLPHESVLTLLLFLKHETDIDIWNVALDYLNRINWLNSSIVMLKKDYMKLLIEPHFSKKIFDFSGKSRKKQKFWVKLIMEGCDSGVEGCREEIFRLFDEFKRSFPNVTMEKHIRFVVLCLASKYDENNKNFLISILPQIKDKELIWQVQDSIMCAISLARQHIGVNFKNESTRIFKLFKTKSILSIRNPVLEQLEMMEAILEEPYGSVAYVEAILEICDQIHDPEVLTHFRSLFSKDVFKAQKQSTEEIIRMIQTNIEWKSKYSEEIRSALLGILGKIATKPKPIKPTTLATVEQTTKALRMGLTHSLARSYIFTVDIWLHTLSSTFLCIFLVIYVQ